jgi:drug/metabolite transporter (DMT)-like permease
MLAAVGLFAIVDVALKVLVQWYPPMQVSFLRAATSLPVVLLPLLFNRRWRELRTSRPGFHLLRGLLGVASLLAYVQALQELSLSNMYAIFLSAPLIVAALSVALLKEQVDWHRWLGIGAGLLGVLIILRPGAGAIGLGGLAALAAALCYALIAISMRALGRTDTTASMVWWYLVAMAIVTGVLAAPGWVALDLGHAFWIVLLGVVGAAAQHTLTEAFRYAPASAVAPFEYTSLLWGVGFDLVLWGVLPSPLVLAGGAVVIGGGLYVIHCERKVKS